MAPYNGAVAELCCQVAGTCINDCATARHSAGASLKKLEKSKA